MTQPRLRHVQWPPPSARSRCADCGKADYALFMLPTDGRWLCQDCGAARADAHDADLERAFLARLEEAR